MIEKIFVCGDIISENKPFEFDTKMAQIIKEAKLSICNLEAPITHDNQEAEIKAGPSISNYQDAVKDLSSYGFDLFCLANNHIFDYGVRGLATTIETIQENNKQSIGATLRGDISDSYNIQIIGGSRVAIINGGENQFGTFDAISRYQGKLAGYFHCFDSLFLQTISKLKERNDIDFILCIIHAGLEETEVPLPQFREFYRYLCDLGADMVIGHHPHWAQGYENYSGKLIFYSLGNFYFDTKGNRNTRETESYSLMLSFENKKFVDFQPIFHKFDTAKILCWKSENELSFSLANLNNQLESHQYHQEIQRIIKDFYPIYERYYSDSLMFCSSHKNLMDNLKTIVKKLFKRKLKFDALLLHNIQIETHRFVQELALRQNIFKNSKKN